jgi:streptogramin lyase
VSGRLLRGLLVVLVISLGIGACGGGDDADTSTSSDASASAPTTITPSEEIKTVNLRKAGATEARIDGDWLIATGDAVWLTTGTGVDRLEPRTGEQTGDVRVPGGPCLGGAYGFGAMFVPTCVTDEALVRIDPKTQRVTDRIRVPTPDLYNEEGSIAAGEGSVWMILDGQGCEACVLAGFDPKTLSMTHQIDLDPGAASVAVGNGLVWVSDAQRNRVLRVDPRSDEVVGETEVGGLPQYLAVDSNGVWVINQLEGTVMQLDPRTGELIKTIQADMKGAGGSITVGEGSVWVRGTLTLLKQIDSKTGEVVAEYGPAEGSGDALVRGGVLWVSAFRPGHGTGPGSGVVYRLPLS